MRTPYRDILLLLCCALAAASCGIIDEDNSDCGQQLTLRYPVMLSPQPADEIARELSSPGAWAASPRARAAQDVSWAGSPRSGEVAAALTRALAAYDRATQTGGYTDGLAHTLSMHFAQTAGNPLTKAASPITAAGNPLTRADGELPPYTEEYSEPDSPQPVESLYLPFGTYRHHAVANGGRAVKHAQTPNPNAATSRVLDCTPPSKMMAYSARRDIIVDDETPATLTVPLYPVNSLVALVVDSTDVEGAALTATVSGLATDFSAEDSVYSFTPSAAYALSPVEMPRPFAAYTVCAYPSGGRAIKHAQTPNPNAAMSRVLDSTPPNAYTLAVYVTLAGGTVTENIITVSTPLLPGCLKVIKMRLRHDGSLATDLPDVGVTVTLDWHKGGTYEPVV